jgi:hypothetical protein
MAKLKTSRQSAPAPKRPNVLLILAASVAIILIGAFLTAGGFAFAAT